MKNKFKFCVMIFSILLFVGCKNQKSLKLDLINGYINNIPITEIIILKKLPSDWVYIDRETRDEKFEIFEENMLTNFSNALNSGTHNSKDYFRNKYGMLYTPGYSTAFGGVFYTRIEFVLDNKDYCYSEGTVYKGEITAGISSQSSVNEIRQLFGKEAKSWYRKGSSCIYMELIYTNILEEDIEVSFYFSTNLEETQISKDNWAFKDNEGNIIYQNSDGQKYALALTSITIERSQF